MSRALGLALGLSLLACAPHAVAPEAPPRRDTSSAWHDQVAQPERDAVLRLRTAELLADPVYAPLVRQLFRAMTEQTLRAGTDMATALEGADELELVVEDGTDPLIVMRKVPARLDPATMSGLDGALQWRAGTAHVPGGAAFDFVPQAGALYVLLDRTWVIAAGPSQARVQTAFDRSVGRPVAPEDAAVAPITLRVPGPALERVAVARGVRALLPVFDELRLATVELRVVKGDKSRTDALVAELAYRGVRQAERAEEVLVDLFGAFSRRGGKRWEWLSDATVERRDQHVTARANLPAWVLASLAEAEGGPL